MKQQTSTTSYIAIIMVIGVMIYFFASAFGYFKASESNQTQINQILYGALMLVLGYYFGASKKRDSPTDQQAINTNKMNVKADDVNINQNGN